MTSKGVLGPLDRENATSSLTRAAGSQITSCTITELSEWADDQLADGVYRWADGAEYDGELDDALRPHGRGGYVGAGGERYDGEFARGVRAGRGVSRLPGGDEYEGDWGDNQRHGRGTLRLAGGGSYEGGFEAGRRSGQVEAGP